MKVIGKGGSDRGVADPDSVNLMRLIEAQRYADVEKAARGILARNGRHALALKALSFALVALGGRDEEVLQIVDKALRLTPADGELHNNRGIALSMLMRWDEAITSFHEALRRAPQDPEIYKNLGYAWFRMGHWNEAVVALLKAVEVHPDDYVEAMHILVSALINGQRWDEAASCVQALYASHPDDPSLLCKHIHIDLRRCDWTGVAENILTLRQVSANFRDPVGNPAFALPMFDIGDRDHATIAMNHAVATISPRYLDATNSLSLNWLPSSRRLRIAYMSADFRDHAVGSAIAEVIEQHDGNRVELFGYAINESDGSAVRRRLEQAFEHFVDVATMSVHATAHRIRGDGIDILVDLTGWTANGRIEALAIRCAPIQVNWLGYAGTLGHPNLADYVIGDPVVMPHSVQDTYTETIVHMPHSYMPLDTTRAIAPPPTRQSQGMPENAFVLCSLNNSYKFNPPLFDLWCSLLAEMPDAVLWLPHHNDTVAENLRHEVERRGIDAGRLVLASRVDSQEEHLARLQLADLALDTSPYNSHSTGADALWVGIPMVAKLGNSFAARVGASLLTAAGLPELIAADDAGYSRLVLELHRDRPRLANLRERLAAARKTAPLFDMKRFARDLEDLYFTMAGDASQAATVSAARLPPARATAI